MQWLDVQILPHAPLGCVVCIDVLVTQLIPCMTHTSNQGPHQDINANHVFDVSHLCMDIRTPHNFLYVCDL